MTPAHDRFRAAPFRPPALAGYAYPAEPAVLSAQLDDFLERAEQKHALQNGATCEQRARIAHALLSPHIDYARGGVTYAEAWKRAAPSLADIDTVIVFATDHGGIDPFTLTPQHYATPFGVLPTDRPIVDALAAVIDEELGTGAAFAGELRHRREHSIELVVTWLHHMLRRNLDTHLDGDPALTVVPILCGSLRPFFGTDGPQSSRAIASVLDALRALTADRRVLVVASGDLAHVGPAFGGAPVRERERRALRAADERVVEAMASGSAVDFYRELERVDDRNNVCGLAPIYHTLAFLEGASVGANGAGIKGTLTGYDQCLADSLGTSWVSIGGMVFG